MTGKEFVEALAAANPDWEEDQIDFKQLHPGALGNYVTLLRRCQETPILTGWRCTWKEGEHERCYHTTTIFLEAGEEPLGKVG